MRRALRVFIGLDSPPVYKLARPSQILTMNVEPPTGAIRPYVLCAVLRDCTFGNRAYNSFLDLQDRLHHNIARRRTLVAIGTHDLDTLTPPFRYTARPPADIKFVPLAQSREFTAEELFAFYNDSANNSPLKKFLHIIEGARASRDASSAAGPSGPASCTHPCLIPPCPRQAPLTIRCSMTPRTVCFPFLPSSMASIRASPLRQRMSSSSARAPT
eukprot:scaffold206129_cov36-Tisochrysis_lutea.AAC.3